MNRITPERCKAAYAKCGYKPEQDVWIDSESKSCCGQIAVLIAEYGFIGGDKANNDGSVTLEEVVAEMAAQKQFGEHYANGFLMGFDFPGVKLHRCKPSDYYAGHADGVACAKAVFGDKP